MVTNFEIKDSFDYLNKKIENDEYEVEDFLGFYHENCMDTMVLLFLEEKGCELYGKSLVEIQEVGLGFLEEIMQLEDITRCVKLLTEFALKRDETKVLSYVQRLKLIGDDQYKPYFTCAKLNLAKNTFQCITTPMTGIDEFKGELNRILGESKYIENNVELYTSFSSREREVISMVCLGKPVKVIAEELCLSPHTIDKHKKNIFKKGQFTSNVQLIEFALNFNLI